jgi:WD40 repeat protein/tRNA A-37 threonylcarbamoyl transferase component Bud32
MKTELLRERYEPLEVVGRGGEGEVIRALDHLHGRQVALKVRSVADDASRAHLLSEARLLLSLSPHPGLPLVREDFFVDDRYVIAMDWIDGTDLEALLGIDGDPGLDPARLIGYLEEAAESLEHLHTHDPAVVHGDVKPANLILTSSGRVVLVDFGLSSTPTDDLRRAGTAGYVAPEIAAGGRPTVASDVYSLAATAVTLLTGGPPTGSESSWGSIDVARIPALERVVRRSLATDPGRRDASAAAFVARLRRWWGAELPTGTVTLVLTDVSTLAAQSAEDSVAEVARTHGGHSVSPADDGVLTAAFASAQDGLDAARELAGSLRARVSAVTGESELRSGSYHGETASAAARLLELADPRQVLTDDATARTIDGRLPPELAFAEVHGDGGPAWALVAPGLSIPSRAETCPYRGLMAFRSEDGDVFFGRDEAVASVRDRLLERGFMAVVGASGSGKSSLVRAGVAPAYGRARGGSVVVMTPGSDPVGGLERALSPEPPSLLIVDQLEEVFTLCRDERSRTEFIDVLMDLRDTSSTAVVVVLRADFYGRCADHPRLAKALAEDQCLLGAMSGDELRRAIEGPARAAGLRLETGLVDTMLADVEGEPGALPLLSHALYESWVRRNGRVLTRTGYVDAGGVRGAIAKSADEVYLGCDEPVQVFMRQLFLQLTELGETTEDTRRRVPLTELTSGEAGEAAAILEQLAAARLVVVDDGSAEIAHEALIREWPRLRGWLAEDRDELRARRQLVTAARSWEENGRDDADLYRGTRLAAAVERVADERQLSLVEREFVEASRDAQERELTSAQRRARRLRALLAVVAAALVVAVIAGSFALVQRGSARRTATVAQAGRLAAESREVAAQRPDLALLLALEAGRVDDSVDTRGALLGALERGSRIRAWLQGFDSPVVATAFNPSRTLLATTTIKGTTLYDTKTWKPVGPFLRSLQGDYSGIDFSPDGKTLAIAGGEGRVELWDVSTTRKVRELTDPAAATSTEPALATVRYSPDGSVLAAGGQEANHVTLWATATGRPIGRPITVKPPGGGAQRISFSPDSTRFVTPGAPGTVGIWEVATGRRVGKPLVTGSDPVSAAIFADDGRTLIASDESGSVSMVDVVTGRPIRAPLSVGRHPADSLDLSPDGRLLAAASFDGSVFVWNAKTGEPFGSPLTVDTSPVNEVAFSPDGRTLVSGHQQSAVVWSMDGDQTLGKPIDGGIDLTTDVSFSPDGTRFVAGQFDGDVVEYDTATQRQALLLHIDSVVTAVAFAPDGKHVAVGSIDGRVRLLDSTSGATVGFPLDGRTAAVWQVAFSPDGRLLAVAVDPNGSGDGFYAQQRQGEVQFWNVGSRSRVGRKIMPGTGTVFAVAFSPDGTLLATGSGGRLDLWDVATQAHHGEPMRVSDDGVLSVAFDPTGRLVAGGGATGPARVWRVSDQRPAFPPLTGHTGPITGAAFDATGSYLATTSHIGGSRLWDPGSGLPFGEELAGSTRWLGPRAPSIDLPFLSLRNAFSPDGRLLAVSGVETLGMLWDVDPALWRERACAIAGRNMTREEWNLHLPPGTAYRATCPEWPTA